MPTRKNTDRLFLAISASLILVADAAGQHAGELESVEQSSPAEAADGQADGAEASLHLPPFSDDDAWLWRVQPMFWLPATSGKFRAGEDSDMRYLNQLNLDNPTPSVYFEAHVRRRDWRFSFDAFFFSDSGETRLRNGARMFGLTLPADTDLDTSLDAWSLSGGAWYRFFDHRAASDESGHEMRFDLLAGGGLRTLGVDASVDISGGAKGSESDFFAQGFLGARAELVIDRRFAFFAQADAGLSPFQEDFSALHLASGAEWRFHENATLTVGYQHMDVDVEGDLSWDGRIAGMYVGLGFTF
jgi:hypothetical protein